MDPALRFQSGLRGPRTLGIDLAKNLFRVHGVDAHGRTVVERELRRRQLVPFVAQLRPCLVGMEACDGHTTGPARLPSADTRSG